MNFIVKEYSDRKYISIDWRFIYRKIKKEAWAHQVLLLVPKNDIFFTYDVCHTFYWQAMDFCFAQIHSQKNCYYKEEQWLTHFSVIRVLFVKKIFLRRSVRSFCLRDVDLSILKIALTRRRQFTATKLLTPKGTFSSMKLM